LLFSEYSPSSCWLKISFLQAADELEDRFAPPSPKKVVTQAAQRRRTADEQAREEEFHRDLAHPNKFAALADGGELTLGEADIREEPGQDSEASSQSRLVPLSCLHAAYLFCRQR
jgi:hypothetical protein